MSRNAGKPMKAEALFDADDPVERGEGEPELKVSLEGFEGPLDLLLTLARTKGLDLRRISILELADQYLNFIAEARTLRLELAADYLVMAAWLAYLKSRLLLPDRKPLKEEPSAEVMAEDLARRLEHLEKIRLGADYLQARIEAHQQTFPRGESMGLKVQPKLGYEASLYDLLSAFAQQAALRPKARYQVTQRQVVSLKEARSEFESYFATQNEWRSLASFVEESNHDEHLHGSLLSSSFAASLEIVREGKVDIAQEGTFAPLYYRYKRAVDENMLQNGSAPAPKQPNIEMKPAS